MIRRPPRSPLFPSPPLFRSPRGAARGAAVGAPGAPGGKRMRVVQIPNGQFVENCYFVIDEATAECAIIDPGEEAGLIAYKLQAEAVRPVGIWLTHAHIDHVLGVPRLKADRSEEHTSELQSQSNLVCRLLLEKKKRDIYHLP